MPAVRGSAKKRSIIITGSAFTGHEGGSFPGVFVNPQTKQTIPGFYGYLLTLHETLNAFTGKIGGGGWPTDWWADHRSPFPNAMDEQVMRYIGNAQNNRTLKDAAEAQHVRFALPDQKSYDRQVVMFDNLFDQFGGFDGLSRFFRLVEEDGIRWPVVGHDATFSGDNHSEQLSEYVIAYLSLGFETKKDLTPVLSNAGSERMTRRFRPISSTLPPSKRSPTRTARSMRRRRRASYLRKLQPGDYQHALASGGTIRSRPNECAWAKDRCVAKW